MKCVAGPSMAIMVIPIASVSFRVPMGLRPTQVDENPREWCTICLAWDSGGPLRSGYVEAVSECGPERVF